MQSYRTLIRQFLCESFTPIIITKGEFFSQYLTYLYYFYLIKKIHFEITFRATVLAFI